MIVELNGHTLHEARQAAHRFLERTNSNRGDDAASRRFHVPDHILKIERDRMRAKVKATRRLRQAILEELDAMRARILKPFGLRESAADDAAGEIGAAAAAGTITYAERQKLLDELHSALDSIDPRALVKTIAEIQAELYQLGMQSAAAEIGTSWDEPPQQAIDALYHSTLEFTTNFADREKVAIKDALLAGLDAGDSSILIAQRIRDTLDDGVHFLGSDGSVTRVLPADSWADMVARTEITRAMSGGILATYQAAGIKTIMWLAAEDERTCPLCDDLDGTTVPMGGVFEGGVDAPPLHPMCRCTIVSANAGSWH